jgi:hypothetical protein
MMLARDLEAGSPVEVLNAQAYSDHLDCADPDILVLCKLKPSIQRGSISRAAEPGIQRGSTNIRRAAEVSDNAGSA